MKILSSMALCVACLIGQSATAATLNGDTIGGQALFNPAAGPFNAFAFPNTNSGPVNAVVRSGVEFQRVTTSIDLTADISGDMVTIVLRSLINSGNSTVGFEFIFSDLDFDVGVLSGFSTTSSSWIGTPTITVGTDSVSILFGIQSLAALQERVFVGSFETSVAAVPLPASSLLLVGGLAGMFGLRRRRQNKV